MTLIIVAKLLKSWFKCFIDRTDTCVVVNVILIIGAELNLNAAQSIIIVIVALILTASIESANRPIDTVLTGYTTLCSVNL